MSARPGSPFDDVPGSGSPSSVNLPSERAPTISARNLSPEFLSAESREVERLRVARERLVLHLTEEHVVVAKLDDAVHALRANGCALLLDAVALGHDRIEVLGGSHHLRPRRIDVARGGAEVAHGFPRLVERGFLRVVPARLVRRPGCRVVHERLRRLDFRHHAFRHRRKRLEEALGGDACPACGRIDRQSRIEDCGQAHADQAQVGYVAGIGVAIFGQRLADVKARLEKVQSHENPRRRLHGRMPRIGLLVCRLVRAEQRIDLFDGHGKPVILALVGIVGVLPVNPREEVFGVGVLQLSAGAARTGEGIWLDDESIG